MGFLQGKRALVTGIASQRSIATGIADAMHREGAELALTYQNDKLKSRVEDAAADYGSKIVLPLDVADDGQIDACFAELGTHWPDGFYILVHCIAFAPREAQLRAHVAFVLDALDDAGLPSEFMLIPFVESRYRSGARSPGGQVGLWQFTATTAKRNGLDIAQGRDQRLDPHASTRAAVRHLRRLHRMFGNDWRWTAMAYNAGEGAARNARRKGGAQHLPSIARHYPDKLHALACLVPRPPDRDRPTR
jgi:hypothetical protein